MHYDLVDLRMLLALARAGSLSRAAEEVHLTVSALSVRLKRLEEEAGTLLFERSGKGLVQTPAALVLVKAARRVLEAAASLEEDFAPYARREEKPLRILSNSTGLEISSAALRDRFLQNTRRQESNSSQGEVPPLPKPSRRERRTLVLREAPRQRMRVRLPNRASGFSRMSTIAMCSSQGRITNCCGDCGKRRFPLQRRFAIRTRRFSNRRQ